MTDNIYHYDVIVIGAGHAGTEAAAAASRLGAKTALLTNNLDTVGQMSCNPAIGGVAKGQIVREVDALGGLMGHAIDATGIQFRLLNRRKGPAMHSPRAQADKKAYQNYVKYQIESQDHLDLRQETVEDLMVIENGTERRIGGVRVRGGAEYRADNVVLTTGTFLQAIMHTGETIKQSRHTTLSRHASPLSQPITCPLENNLTTITSQLPSAIAEDQSWSL
jgi:tRNA uridine 5-carboxymethylaminomethyl modification enzyme